MRDAFVGAVEDISSAVRAADSDLPVGFRETIGAGCSIQGAYFVVVDSPHIPTANEPLWWEVRGMGVLIWLLGCSLIYFAGMSHSEQSADPNDAPLPRVSRAENTAPKEDFCHDGESR